MALPKKKSTRAARGHRRSHQTLSLYRYTFCSKCGQPVLPHHVCQVCGTYAGRKVLSLKTKSKSKKKTEKKNKKETQKETKK